MPLSNPITVLFRVQGHMSYLTPADIGDPDRMFIGGVDCMYRMSTYDGDWDEGERHGHGES